MKKSIMAVIGTRPEVIKMAPLILQMKIDPEIKLTVLSLAQHRELLDQMLATFEITPDIDLNIMKKNQTLPELTANLPVPLDNTLKEINPDFVLAQGDTTSTFMTSLACAYRKIPFGHVEAGLRTYNFEHPFPEEMNRVLISQLTALHFAPTKQSELRLLKEGIPQDKIFITGNPVIDALKWILKRPHHLPIQLDPGKKLILVTLHRRESWDTFPGICRTIRKLADEYSTEIQFLLPVHPNPNVSSIVHEVLDNHPNIRLTEPLDYVDFVAVMKKAYLILSDSGGVQEEAPALGVPVLVLRKHTERTEAVDQGFCRLVGTDPQAILQHAREIISNPLVRALMVSQKSPYGDGHAAQRIISHVKDYLT
jgi:UDP-N-acetylglucosamine 2-epimerase (non-hydrolysing)